MKEAIVEDWNKIPQKIIDKRIDKLSSNKDLQSYRMDHKSPKLFNFQTLVCNQRFGRNEVLTLRNDFFTNNSSNGRSYCIPIFSNQLKKQVMQASSFSGPLCIC